MNDRRSEFRKLARWCAILSGIVTMMAAGVAAADPPTRVARLAYVDGTVSFQPAGDDQRVSATVNRPLVAGDRLWSDQGGRAELQMTDAAVRLGPLTNVSLINIDDRTEQFELTQGVLQLQVYRLNSGETIEIDTPNFAFSITRPGSFRFDVDLNNGSTLVAVRGGEGEAYGEGAAYRIGAGRAFRFYGTDLSEREYLALPPPDAFERWIAAREARHQRVAAARYVAPDVIGYEDLDPYGSWQAVPQYGRVWFPRDVPSGWAPYRDGHWAWIDPWGWTWVSDEPWGFAPFHYGRWALVRDRWCWVPGPVDTHPVYAPALVAFVGGSGFSVAVSGGAIGWFPLAPGEVYRPAYPVSRDYFTRVNVTNTTINTTVVANNYNNRESVANLRYAYRERPAAVTVVSQETFVRAQPVQRAAVHVAPEALNRAEVLPVARIAPQRPSITGAAAPARGRPPYAALERTVVAKAPPPPPPIPVAAKLPQLSANPGRPLERPAAGPGQPQAAQAESPRRNVRVVQATQPQPAPRSSTPPGQARRAEAQREAVKLEPGRPGGAPSAPAGEAPREAPSAPTQAARPSAPPPQARAPEPQRPSAPPPQARAHETPRPSAPSPQARAHEPQPPTAPPPQARAHEAPRPSAPPPQARAPEAPRPSPPPPQARAHEPPRPSALPQARTPEAPRPSPPPPQARAPEPQRPSAPPPQAHGKGHENEQKS